MPAHFLKHLQVRPRMMAALAIGLTAGLLSPWGWHAVTRWLLGWNLGVWSYLLLMAWMMARADHGHLRKLAREHAQSAPFVLALVILAALASLAAIVAELSSAKEASGGAALPHIALAASTVLGAWLLLPTVFTLSYATHFHSRHSPAPSLRFPEADESFEPHYSDFLYFAFTIAVAAQTSDVCVASRSMRRLVLLQAVLSFAFNTAILALAVNIAAGLI
jgi:uncharacterized membrane protein